MTAAEREQYERIRLTLESQSVKLMRPRSPFWRCQYCEAISQSPIGFPHKPECVMAPLPVVEPPTRGGPTEQFPDAPYCKPDQSCCDWCCGN
jgi:hypothetical protein